MKEEMELIGHISKVSPESSLNVFMLTIPVDVYLFNLYDGNTRTVCEICSKLTIKTSDRRSVTSLWCFYCYLWTDFTQCFGVFIVNTAQENAGWDNAQYKYVA